MDLRYRNVRGERYTLDDLIDVTFRITIQNVTLADCVVVVVVLCSTKAHDNYRAYDTIQ